MKGGIKMLRRKLEVVMIILIVACFVSGCSVVKRVVVNYEPVETQSPKETEKLTETEPPNETESPIEAVTPTEPSIKEDSTNSKNSQENVKIYNVDEISIDEYCEFGWYASQLTTKQKIVNIVLQNITMDTVKNNKVMFIGVSAKDVKRACDALEDYGLLVSINNPVVEIKDAETISTKVSLSTGITEKQFEKVKKMRLRF